jgi:hypothetical protein
MSKLNRQKQHRPPRDTAKNKELADLRRENHKLKQQVARTRKAAARAVESNDSFRGIDRGVIPMPEMKGPTLTRELLQGAVEKVLGACSCGGEWKRLELGPKTIEVCVGCTARRPVKPASI